MSFPTPAEKDRIISGIRWIGLLSSDRATIRAGTLLDTLCARLEELMKYEPRERDMVMLQHKFVIQWADGREVSPRSGGVTACDLCLAVLY